MKFKSIHFIVIMTLCLCVGCKKDDYRLNGTDMPYVYVKQHYTPPPEGYEPFYVNYIGRHGARYPISDKYIIDVLSILQDADAKYMLTNKGKELVIQLNMIKDDLQGKWGLLSPKGEAEIRGIAQRMITNYPNVFEDHIYAQADNIERCTKSMVVFLDEIEKKTGNQNVTTETYPKENAILNFFDVNMAYQNYKKEGDWKKEYQVYADSLLGHNRLIYQLFISIYADSLTNNREFLRSLYRVYASLPITDIDISIKDLFTGEEIFTFWDIENVRRYLEMGPSPMCKDRKSVV